MAVTHDMIAVKLGINRTTVTKALKNDPSIKKKTRLKVVEAANMMGFDFKQSQQNRREGKRYYIHEEINFQFLDKESGEKLNSGSGMLTNLSNTGSLFQIKKIDKPLVPTTLFNISISITDESAEYKEIPLAKIVRFTYHHGLECAARFVDDVLLGLDVLESLEKHSFTKIDAKKALSGK